MNYKKIQSIKRIKKTTQVFNFNVPKYETYIANGFVVHNCQNFKVSQTTEGQWKYHGPADLVDLALEKGVVGIAFTYNEPTIYCHYIAAVIKEIRSKKCSLKVVLKTNGFVQPPILKNILSNVDAWNVDIKGDDSEYQRVCGGSLEPVLEALRTLRELDAHIEVSYLVLPRVLNSMDFHTYVRDFLEELSKDIPVHLLYFYPFHKMSNEDKYTIDELISIKELFSEKMRYVYISNNYERGGVRNTYCPECSDVMIDRTSRVKIHKTSCHVSLPGIFCV